MNPTPFILHKFTICVSVDCLDMSSGVLPIRHCEGSEILPYLWLNMISAIVS